MAHQKRNTTILLILLPVLLGGGFLAWRYIPRLNVSYAYDIDTSVPKVIAKPADSLVESMGVGEHFVNSALPAQEVYDDLAETGFRYIRDDIGTPYDTFMTYGNDWIQRIQHLKQQGVSTLGIASINVPATDIPRYLHAANDAVPNTLYAIDGPDETDFGCAPTGLVFTGNIWVQCNPDNLWLAPAEQYMTALRNALQADPATRSLPVYSISESSSHYYLNSTTLQGNTSDYANVHYYPIFTTPWMNDSMENEMNQATTFYHGKPVVITEIGYPSTPLSPQQGSTELMQAQVLPDYYLQSYALGIKRMFMYDFIAANDEIPLGLIDATTHHKKQAYYSLKNFIAIFSDRNTSFTPGSIRYELVGASSKNVNTQLFQKSDGSYYIALWLPKTTDSPAPTTSTINDPAYSQTVNIKFGTAIDTAKFIDITNNNTITNTYNQPTTINNVHIGLGPVIIKLTPSADPTPTPSPTSTPSNSSHPNTPTPTPKKGHTPTPSASTAATPTPKPTTSAKPIPTPDAPPARGKLSLGLIATWAYQLLLGRLR